MTRPRYDDKSTEFGLWLRDQASLDSKLGYVATNIDFLWTNYKTGEWMLIEEKRYGASVKSWQYGLFMLVDKACKLDKKYRGFHVIRFEKTSPEDGKIWLGNKEITKIELLKLLQFDKGNANG